MMKSEAKKSEIKKCNVEFEWQMPNILYRKQTRYTRLKTMQKTSGQLAACGVT